MTREQAVQIFEAVKLNQRRLEACAGPHDFQKLDPDKLFGARYRCTKCTGEVENLHCMWYERGLAHARAATAKEAPS